MVLTDEDAGLRERSTKGIEVAAEKGRASSPREPSPRRRAPAREDEVVPVAALGDDPDENPRGEREEPAEGRQVHHVSIFGPGEPRGRREEPERRGEKRAEAPASRVLAARLGGRNDDVRFRACQCDVQQALELGGDQGGAAVLCML